MSDPHFSPLRVTFVHADNGHLDRYIDFFRAPVSFSENEDALYFDSATLRQPLPAGDRELAYQNDRITERYLATLNPDQVQDKVREIRHTLAQQFIRERRYSLSQIAYLLGFSDQANFSRAFKRWTGTTPTDFRSSGTLEE